MKGQRSPVHMFVSSISKGVQWLSGRVLDSRPKGRGFEPHRHHCVLSLSKNINPSLVLVQPRKTRPFITERLLMGRKESNQTNKSSISNGPCFNSFHIHVHFNEMLCRAKVQWHQYKVTFIGERSNATHA